MTSHELARKLLEGPDWPVIVRGYGQTYLEAHPKRATVEQISFCCEDTDALLEYRKHRGAKEVKAILL